MHTYIQIHMCVCTYIFITNLFFTITALWFFVFFFFFVVLIYVTAFKALMRNRNKQNGNGKNNTKVNNFSFFFVVVIFSFRCVINLLICRSNSIFYTLMCYFRLGFLFVLSAIICYIHIVFSVI